MGSEDLFFSTILKLERRHVVPVIVRKQNDDKAEWIYSESYVEYLKSRCLVKFTRKEDRVKIIKKLLDMYSEGILSIPTAHAALICLYLTNFFTLGNLNLISDELSEKDIGQKRLETFSMIPEISIFADDDFFAFQLKKI
jgi:hypothetical protein